MGVAPSGRRRLLSPLQRALPAVVIWLDCRAPAGAPPRSTHPATRSFIRLLSSPLSSPPPPFHAPQAAAEELFIASREGDLPRLREALRKLPQELSANVRDPVRPIRRRSPFSPPATPCSQRSSSRGDFACMLRHWWWKIGRSRSKFRRRRASRSACLLPLPPPLCGARPCLPATRSQKSWAPAHWAVDFGHVDCLEELLEWGAESSPRNIVRGQPAAPAATLRARSRPCGARPLLCGAVGCVQQQMRACATLITGVFGGALPYLCSTTSSSAPLLLPQYKRTPLHKAALEGHTRCVEALLEAGTSKDIRDWVRAPPRASGCCYSSSPFPSPRTPPAHHTHRCTYSPSCAQRSAQLLPPPPLPSPAFAAVPTTTFRHFLARNAGRTHC